MGKKGGFRFWIASGDQRVYLCLSYLHISAILWNYIQANLQPLLLALLLLNLDELLTPCTNFMFGFHDYSTLHWHTCQLGRNTLGVMLFIMSLSLHQHLIALIIHCI